MQEKSEHPSETLTVKHVKIEPDKVEQVKTELAKAKAELAKIKEKLRGDHRDSSVIPAKVEKNKNSVCLSENVTISEEPNNEEQAVPKYQQKQESIAVSKPSVTQADRGGDDYERVREKYGFMDYTSTNRQKPERKASSNNNDETQTPSRNRVETVKDDKSKPKDDLENTSSAAARENTEDVGILKTNEVKHSHYGYSEFPKEFKLSRGDSSSTTAKSGNTDSSSDKIKKDNSENVEKCFPPKQIDITKQRDLDQAKPLNAERKSKLSEHTAAPSTDQHIAPSRPLTHKERAQTKQEILTSKIKAHAEKEISAIKGFAIRDGLISKNFSKPLAGSQRPEAQRPPAQEASNKQEIPSKTTPNLQMEAVKSVSPQTSATTPLKPVAITSQLKTKTKVPSPARETNWMGIDSIKTEEALVENQMKEKKSEFKQTKEAPQSKQENCTEKTENTSHHTNNDNSVQGPQKIEAPENVQGKNEVVNKDLEPSLQLVFGRTDTVVVDDSLQIMGIMVTVHERKQSVDNGLVTQEQMNPGEQEGSSPVANSFPQLSQEKASSTDAATIKDESTDAQSISHLQENSAQVKRRDTESWTDHQVLVEKDSVGQDGVKIITEEASSQKTYRSENSLAKTVQSARVISLPAIKDDTESSMKLDTTVVINPSSNSSISVKESSTVERRKEHPIQTNPNPPHPVIESKNTNMSTRDQHKEEETGENLEEQCVHIDNIAIRVVQTVTEEDNKKLMGKRHDVAVPSDVAGHGGHKQAETSHLVEKESEDTTKDLAPASTQSSRNINPKDITTNCEDTGGKNEKPESEIQQMEEDYFHVQSAEKANKQAQRTVKVRDTCGVSAVEDPTISNEAFRNESCSENKKEVFGLDQCENRRVDSSSISLQNDILERKIVKTQHIETDSPTVRQLNSSGKTDVDQSVHVTKQQSENQPGSLAREGQRAQLTARQTMFQEKPEVKPRTKERTSTIPEISAIADYARLKVIVSDDQANTIQEFPPNKKEGFFPLIQSRHSRRPAYTADHHALSVKEEKSFPKKTEVSSKVNKEPKPLVFPITEKEHQRTGMFKLGDKEKQEKMKNEKTPDFGSKRAEYLQEGNKTTSIHQSNIPSVQTTTSSSANRTGQTFTSQSKQVDKCDPNEKLAVISYDEGMPYLDQISKPQMHNEGGKKEMTPGKDDNINNEQNHVERNKPEREDRVSAQQAETEANIKIKLMLEESKASLAEEEQRATQREVERRVQEREAIATQIKERRQKQREAERKAEEERRAKQKEEETKNKNQEERLAKQKQEDLQKTEESKRKKQQQQEVEVHQRQLQAAEEEQQRRAGQKKQQRGEAPDEQNRRVAVVEEPRGVAHREEQRNRVGSQDEPQRRATQEGELKRRVALEGQRRSAQDKWQREAVQEEQQRRAVAAEQPRGASQEEDNQREAVREKGQQRRVAQEEEMLKRAVQEEMERRKASQNMEQLRRAAEIQEQQLRKAAQEEQQRRAAREEEQKRRAADEEQQRRAAWEEQLRRAAQEEEKLRRAAQEEEKLRRAAQEEEQRRRAAEEEQLRRAAQKEQQRRAAWEEEQKRRAADEEQLRRAAQEEEQRRRSAQEEQLRKEEQQRMLAIEEQQRKAKQEKEIQIQAVQKEEQLRRATQEEKLKTAAQEEELRREDQQRRVAIIEEQQRRAVQGKQQRTSPWIEAKHQTDVDIEEKNKRNQRDEGSIQILEEKLTMHSKMKADQQTEEQRDMRPSGETRSKTHRDEENRRAVQKETEICNQRDGIKTNKTPRIAEQRQVVKVEGDMAQEQVLTQREEEMKAQRREDDKERTVVHRDKEQRRAAQMVDALQYYTIASESDRKGRERQRHSPPTSTRRTSSTVPEAPENPHHRPSRPSAPASPAVSLPRSNTSSPAVGSKPSMFLVKDNASRGSSFLKSVKPRFHKNFGEDFIMGSPAWSETGEEEQEAMRQRATTPLHQDTGPNRLTAIRESSTLQPWQDTPVPHPHHHQHQHHHRPFSRRSLALDEDDSRSVVSYMSEDVESFATSAADLSDFRSLYDYERPESSCSFSSDVCRSLGKPPAVPPKSEKALRRAKRLTTRRIKKELSREVDDNTAGVQKPPQEDSRIPPSSGTEVHSPGRRAVATPHFSSPVSLAHTPKGESALPLSRAERQPSHSSQFAAPHPADPIALPAAAVSLPVASPAAIAAAAAAPKIVADVPSSPTLHRTSHPAPVTKYHVESCYPGSYPVTQRKVLQDVGSGQYFVVDMPVQVKTKTFIDPQTGKYVQLNVRESTERGSQLQQTYLQPQASVVPQQQPISQDFPVGKNLGLYRGYNGYPAGVNNGPHNKQSVPVTPYQNQQPDRESRTHRHPASERAQLTEGHYGSPERTPYMDTVSAADKAHNSVYNAHSQYESFPEFDTNSHHLAGSSAYSNVNSAPSQCQPREIKTMSELDDFMELSDW
ncbi:uncharacterized protein LOC142883501 [Nelusetta ayraudi]|uniref:uncharacterized protein LOC142883501 n=1 Tax=Nelusetta ayraudi TaxID=303726 RepID=UPI003F70D58C